MVGQNRWVNGEAVKGSRIWTYFEGKVNKIP